jgi:tetratricopeptide (TPR) repeat protein
MLFDLKGKRRRLVQATYITLALLMGGGLVLFGIGGDVSGGLFDAFSERRGNVSSAADTFKERRDEAQERLRVNPRDEAALKQLVRANYQLASSEAGQATTFPEEAKDELRAAADAWQRYLALDPDPIDESLANLMLQAYGPGALNQLDEAKEVAQILARADESPQAYLRLVQYAALAGDERTAALAGRRAIDLAPRDQRKTVREQVEQAKAVGALQQAREGGDTGG